MKPGDDKTNPKVKRKVLASKRLEQRCIMGIMPLANGCKHEIVGQQLPTLLDVYVVSVYTQLHVVACCWELLCKV